MNPQRTAVVLIEYQNDFTSPGGSLHDAVKGVMESTMRSGYEKGFEVITLTDCTATLSEEEQAFACAKNFPMFSKPMTHNQFLDELTGESVQEVETRGYSA